MHLSGVRPSVRLSVSAYPQQQTRCCRFAAVGAVGRRRRSIATRLEQLGVRWANAGSATLSAYVGS